MQVLKYISRIALSTELYIIIPSSLDRNFLADSLLLLFTHRLQKTSSAMIRAKINKTITNSRMFMMRLVPSKLNCICVSSCDIIKNKIASQIYFCQKYHNFHVPISLPFFLLFIKFTCFCKKAHKTVGVCGLTSKKLYNCFLLFTATTPYGNNMKIQKNKG